MIIKKKKENPNGFFVIFKTEIWLYALKPSQNWCNYKGGYVTKSFGKSNPPYFFGSEIFQGVNGQISQ